MRRSNIKQQTIGSRLWLLVGLFLANVFILGGLTYWNVNGLAVQVRAVTEVGLPSVRTMTLLDMMHDAIRASVYRSIVEAGSPDPKMSEEIRKELDEYSTNIRTYLDSLDALPLSSESKEVIGKSRKPVEAYVEAAHRIAELALAGKVEKATAGLPRFRERFEFLEEELGKLGDLVEGEAKGTSARAHEIEERADFLAFGLTVLSILFGLVSGSWMVRSIRREMSAIIEALSSESRQVNSTAKNLSIVSQRLADSSTQQAGALQETAASVDEISAMVKKTGENSVQLERSAQQSMQAASRGQEAIAQMHQAMTSIQQGNSQIMSQVEDSNQKITEIVKVIAEIGSKTKVINDIVFQTKLLSFNASVEAARAGEHGKGFAVVAEEVGNLAQMSGNAAKEISEMLANSISRVDGIVTESRRKVEALVVDGKGRLENGAQVVKQCGDSLGEIVRQSSEVGTLITEITTAIREQNLGIAEISKALSMLNQSTQSNSGTSREVAVTSEALLGQSTALGKVLSQVRVFSGEAQAAMPAEIAGMPPAPASPETAKVLPLRKPPVEAARPALRPVASAVGSEAIPSQDDPRFEEV